MVKTVYSGAIQLTEEDNVDISDVTETSTRYTFIIEVETFDNCKYKFVWGAALGQQVSNNAPRRINVQDTEKKKYEVKITPNPAMSKVSLMECEEEKSDISIYDISGNVVSNLNDFVTKDEISVSQLPMGTYFIVVKNNDGVGTALFVKK